MVSFINKFIPLAWKVRIKIFFLRFRSLESLPFTFPDKNKKRIFIFLAADYGNLGDVAITYAQHKFLSKHFPNHIVTEIPISKSMEGIYFVEKIIAPDDIITTVGGGNMGDLYTSIELYRQLVIKCFNKNKIISFPQTVDFNDTPEGKKALKKAIRIYSKHADLTLIAREHKSYDFYKNNYKNNNVLLTPDIVLSLDQSQPKYEREGALICLRNDKEKKLTKAEEKSVSDLLSSEFKSIKKRDTHVGGLGLSLQDRVSKLKLIWDDFKKAELVVTDRLHGMIFCYITGTPVIVFLNNNHKIKSSYHWINSAPHVVLVEVFSLENMKEAINEVKGIDAKIDLELINTKYKSIINTIKS